MEFTLNGKTYRYENGNALKRRIFEYALTHSTIETIIYVRGILQERIPVLLNFTDDHCIEVIKRCTPQQKIRNEFRDIKLNPHRNDKGILYRYSIQIEDDDGTVKEISYVGKSYNEYVRRNTNFVQGYQLVKLAADAIENGEKLEDAITRKRLINGALRCLRTIPLFIPTLQRYIREKDYIENNFETAVDKGKYLLSHFNYEVLDTIHINYNIYGQVLSKDDKFLRDLEDLRISLELMNPNIIVMNKYNTIRNYTCRENASINLYRRHLDITIPLHEEFERLSLIEI